MDNLECDGGEASLSDCRFDGWGKHDCEENEGAGVVCDAPEAAVIPHPVTHKPTKIKLKVYYNTGCRRFVGNKKTTFFSFNLEHVLTMAPPSEKTVALKTP